MKQCAAVCVCLALCAVMVGCAQASGVQQRVDSGESAGAATTYGEPAIDTNDLREIYFAGGCFWGIEEYFSRVPGVVDVVSGYANGRTDNPSYADVIMGSGHAETVRISYDPSIISLSSLAEALMGIIDPTSVNRQGGDYGEQYRTGIFYTDESEEATLQAALDATQERYNEAITVELVRLENFFEAEWYHQDYMRWHADEYCTIPFETLDDIKTQQQLDAEARLQAMKEQS